MSGRIADSSVVRRTERTQEGTSVFSVRAAITPMPPGETVGVRPDTRYEREADAAAHAALVTPGLGGRVDADASSRRSTGTTTGGEGLDRASREFFEPRFGWSFADVRVHTDESAARNARRMGAAAYTLGNHIHFAREAYQPRTPAGRELLAHELAHVMQQGAGRRRRMHAAHHLSKVSQPIVQPKLLVTGDTPGFVNFANAVLGVQFEVVVGASDEVSLRKTAVAGPPTPEGQELVRVLRTVIDDSNSTTIEFINGRTSTRGSDAGVLGGDYKLSRVDLDDLRALGTQGSVGLGQGGTGGSVLVHEILEQHRKQVHSEGFPTAHAAAIAVEEVAAGATRGAERFRQVNATTLETTIPYTYPDGRVVEVTWDIVNGNYQKVRRRVVRAAGGTTP